MEIHYKRPKSALERELQVLNQKADRDRQQKLRLIDKQFRFSYKMLEQRKDYLRKEQRKVVTVKDCEPKAIVDIAMKEIDEYSHYRGVQTAYGSRRYTKPGSNEAEQSRSASAPPLSLVRHRGKVRSSVSLMQMKNIAMIDSISEKEKVRRQQRAREELERIRLLQRDALQKKVQEFIEKLKEKSKMDS